MQSEPATGNSSKALLFLAGACLCFGTSGTAQALGPDNSSPLVVGAARLLLGAIGLFALIKFREPKNLPRNLLWIGALAVALFQVTFFSGVRLTGVAMGTVIALGSAPAITAILNWLIYKKLPTIRWIFATCVTAAGITLLFLSKDEIKIDLAGVLLSLGAGASYASYALVSKELLNKGVTPNVVMSTLFIRGAVLTAPLLLLLLNDSAWFFKLDSFAMILWLSFVSLTLAYFLYIRGLAQTSTSNAATITLIEPVTATFLAAVILREAITVGQWIGIGLVIAGLALVDRKN
jgi:DME family drug/metabolite transporter